VAGLLFTSYTAAGYSLNGIGTELDTIAAVVIGGTLLTGGSGYAIGSLVGVLVYGVIKVSITFLGADASWTRITIGILLLAFVVVQRLIVARTSRK
jgi:simple sugar transport system permease protein